MTQYEYDQPRLYRRRMNAGEKLAAVVVAAVALWIGYSVMLPRITSAPAAQQQARATVAPPLPTVAPALAPFATAQANTAAETLPIATPQANQPAAAPQAADPASFSPQDLGNAPLPTPTSALPPEQQQAAAEASEMADLANAQAGLTPAQLETKVHDACWNAGGCGVAK